MLLSEEMGYMFFLRVRFYTALQKRTYIFIKIEHFKLRIPLKTLFYVFVYLSGFIYIKMVTYTIPFRNRKKSLNVIYVKYYRVKEIKRVY